MEQLDSTNSPGSRLVRATASANGVPESSPAARRAALIIGHPGHELCVYEWCRLSKPFVFIVTDGSGRTDLARISRSLGILNGLGCITDSESGNLTDRDVYQALLDQNHQLFIALARKIGRALVLHDIGCVVGDAGEGFSPVHDVCRLIIDAAVAIAESALDRRILNFGFKLDWRKEIEHRAEPDYTTTLLLDQEAFASKLAAARDYTELGPEVDSALNNNGAEAFRQEKLIPIEVARGINPASKPYYEEYGEGQVAAGVYCQVIRYHEHLAPLAEALSSALQGSP